MPAHRGPNSATRAVFCPLESSDGSQATDFKRRTANTGDLGKGVVSAPAGIADRFFRLQNIAQADRVTWSGGRDPQGPARWRRTGKGATVRHHAAGPQQLGPPVQGRTEATAS